MLNELVAAQVRSTPTIVDSLNTTRLIFCHAMITDCRDQKKIRRARQHARNFHALKTKTIGRVESIRGGNNFYAARLPDTAVSHISSTTHVSTPSQPPFLTKRNHLLEHEQILGYKGGRSSGGINGKHAWISGSARDASTWLLYLNDHEPRTRDSRVLEAQVRHQAKHGVAVDVLVEEIRPCGAPGTNAKASQSRGGGGREVRFSGE